MTTAELFSVHGLQITNAVLIAAAFVWSFHRQRLYSILWGALGAFHFVAYLDLLIDPSFTTPDIVIRGQGIILLGNVALLLTLLLFDQGPLSIEPSQLKRPPPKLYGVDTPAARRYLLVMAAGAAVAMAIQFKDGLSVVNTDWIEQRSIADPYYLRPLSTMIGFACFSSLWVAIRKKQVAITCLLALAVFVLFFLLGSRAMFTTIAGAIYLDLLTTRIKLPSKLTLLAMLSSVGYSMHVLLRVLRGLGLGGLISAALTGNLGAWLDGHHGMLGLGGEEGTYRTFYYVIDKDYQSYPYRSWVTPQRMAMIYVPSSSAGELKPRDITTQLWYDGFDDGFLNDSHDYEQLEKIAATEIGGSIHPHLWGDAYANGHLPGVVVYGFGLGLIAVVVDRLFLRSTELSLFALAPCACVGYMFIARGSVVAGFGCVAFTLPIVVLFSMLSGLPLLRKIAPPGGGTKIGGTVAGGSMPIGNSTQRAGQR